MNFLIVRLLSSDNIFNFGTKLSEFLNKVWFNVFLIVIPF